jgi:prevent-host-death family protein
MKTVPAGQFKAKCLAIIDEVNATGETVVITKRGVPAAQLTPVEQKKEHETDPEAIFGSLRGLFTIVGDPDDLVGPIIPLEDWDHLKEDWSPFPPE